MRLLPLLLILGACASARGESPTRDQKALSRELAGREAGAPEDCISATNSSASLSIVDEQTLRYRQGSTIWVNRLPEACPGIRSLDTLVVELHGSRYCRNDLFRSLSSGSRIPGPACRLGSFTPYRRR